MADIAATVGRVINKLSQLVTEEALLHIKVGEDVSILNNKLAWLQTFLEGISERGQDSQNQIQALWVKQAIQLLFEAEDTLDEFSGMTEKVRLWSRQRWKAYLKFQWATQCFQQILVNHKLLRKIEALKDKLEELDNQRTTHQIQFDPLSWQVPSMSKTSLKWDGCDSYEPVDSELHDKLKAQILKGEKKREVIAIIGSGNGISSFGKKVYDSAEVKNHFGVVAWKNLPLKFSLDETFSEIYCKVQGQMDQVEVDSCKQEDKGMLVLALCALLKKRRYLVVFNGIASQDDWEEINNFLPDEKNGSRVLLIPKHESEVAILSESRDNDIITITPVVPLSLQQCKEMFSDIVFGQTKTSCPIEFGPYIPEVHEVTKGDRWSVYVLAILLRTKLSSQLWKKVFGYLWSSIPRSSIDRLLALNFDSLPHKMKSCFLYFSAMQESTGFEADQLVRIWIAEGFIESIHRRTPEEIGEGYIKELISRSLIYVQEKDEFGGIAVVAVNERIHTFLLSVAHGSSFVTLCDNANLVPPTMIRRIAIQNYFSKYVQVEKSLPQLRSFMCDCLEQYFSKHHHPHTMKFLLESKFLRVIDLHGLIIKKLPKKIGNLIHLRYLGVRCGGLQKLPNSIGKLVNLQTLDIRKSSVQNLPESFWGIEELRHVIADTIKLPKRIGKLNNLQTLRTADCTYWKHDKYELLEKIRNIRSLSLEQLTTFQASKISSSLHNLHLLKHLCLKVKESHKLPSTVFTNPNTILRDLHILELYGQLDGQKGFSAQTMPSMPNLVSITLTMSQIGQGFIDMLSKINSLKRVSLCKAYNDRDIRFLSNGFQNLRELELSNLGALEEWIEIDPGTLPKLRKLVLSGCTRLEILPEGLERLQLEEVRIYNMDTLIMEIRNQQGENFEKIKDAKIIKTRLGG